MIEKTLFTTIIFLSISFSIYSQDSIKTTESNDTIIEERNPLIIHKKVFVYEKRGYSGKGIIGFAYGHNIALKEKNNTLSIDTKNGYSVEVSGAYFLNFCRISGAIGYREVQKIISFNSTSEYFETVTYAKVDSEVVAVDMTPHGIYYIYHYDTTYIQRQEMRTRQEHLKANQKTTLVQIPLQLGFPVYYKRFCIIPEIGSLTNIIVKDKILFETEAFDETQLHSKISLMPIASITTILPVYKSLKILASVSYSRPILQKKNLSPYPQTFKIFGGFFCFL